MKKILILLISFFICISSSKAISAYSYIVMDMDTKDVLQQNNMHSPHLIASITKIMTCIIALENSSLDKKVTVTSDIHKAVGSSIYLEVGEVITLKDLLYGMMLRSGNDAALMIALSISGSMEKFSKLMNEKAKSLNMNNTIFYNSHGLEEPSGEGNKSTSYDMAILTSYAMENKEFQKIFKTKKYTCKTNKKTYTWENKNKLLKYDFITGGKTGYTQKAKRTLVTTANIDNKKVVIVTLNDGNDWLDHLSLYENIKNDYILKKVIDKDDFQIKEDNLYSQKRLYVKNDYSKIVKKEDEDKFLIKYYLKKDASPKDESVVGSIVIYFKNNIVYKDNIYISLKKDNFWIRCSKWFKKLFS